MKEDIELFSRSVRGHWSVESMHWHLDVTFKEDANKTIDKRAAENLNIIRKWCISILKMIFLPKGEYNISGVCPVDLNSNIVS